MIAHRVRYASSRFRRSITDEHSDATGVRPHPATSSPRVGPLGRLARVTFRRRGRTVLAWLGGRSCVAVLLSTSLRRRLHGRLLRARLGLQARRRQLLEDRFPSQAGRHRRRRRPRRRRSSRASAAGRRAGPARRARPGRARRGGLRPVRRTRRASARTARPSSRTSASTSRTPSTCRSPTASRCSRSPTRRPRTASRSRSAGRASQQAEQGEIGSEGIGLAAAAIILLITFGSVVAAGLPILVAVAGLAVSSTLTTVVISFVDAPDWSTSLATMMGIGIGIDYALLMVTRFREWRAAGLDPEAATVATLDTAGRSVMVAGTHRGDQHARPVRDGPVVHARRRRRDHPRRARRDGRQHHALPRAAGLPRQARRPVAAPLGRGHTVVVAEGGHVEPSRGWLAWSRLVDRHRIAAALVGVARPARAGRSVPRRPVRLPRRRQQPRGDQHPPGLRHAGRRLRRRHERPAAPRRRAARRDRSDGTLDGRSAPPWPRPLASPPWSPPRSTPTATPP